VAAARQDALGQFEMIADVEEFDGVLVILGKLQERVCP